jgi:hypothetical protein
MFVVVARFVQQAGRRGDFNPERFFPDDTGRQKTLSST